MHGARPAEIEKIVVAADLAVPGVEARAAIALLVEAKRLDHRSHGAVEHEDAIGGKLAQRCCSRGCGSSSDHARSVWMDGRALRCRCVRAAVPADGRSRRQDRRGSWCKNESR